MFSRGLKSIAVLTIRRLSTSVDLDKTIIVTKSCAKRIKQLQDRSGNPKLHLRLLVEGGGCSGFQYVFKMEDSDPSPEEDLSFERDGTQLIIDQSSFELVKGSTVDFVQEMIRSSFAVVNNPQSETACGCGSSFAVKNFAQNPAID